MPRQLRIEYPGAIYHLINRGDRREDIFKDDLDRQRFLDTLAEACQKTDWQVHAFCLMPNHFHLVIETPKANLITGMKWLLGVYTKRFNIRHKICGHLFAGRYKALLVDGHSGGYLKTVCDYVHLNPVRAKLIAPRQPLETFRWSSYPLYLQSAGERPPWLRVERLLGEWRALRDTAASREQWSRRMEKRRQEEIDADQGAVRQGWCLGSEEFRRDLLEAMASAVGTGHYGAQRQETGEQKAERLISQELKREGWAEKDWADLRKGDARKVAVARRLRRETTMSLQWIARRLQMGSWTYVSNLLSEKDESKSK